MTWTTNLWKVGLPFGVHVEQTESHTAVSYRVFHFPIENRTRPPSQFSSGRERSGQAWQAVARREGNGEWELLSAKHDPNTRENRERIVDAAQTVAEETRIWRGSLETLYGMRLRYDQLKPALFELRKTVGRDKTQDWLLFQAANQVFENTWMTDKRPGNLIGPMGTTWEQAIREKALPEGQACLILTTDRISNYYPHRPPLRNWLNQSRPVHTGVIPADVRTLRSDWRQAGGKFTVWLTDWATTVRNLRALDPIQWLAQVPDGWGDRHDRGVLETALELFWVELQTRSEDRERNWDGWGNLFSTPPDQPNDTPTSGFEKAWQTAELIRAKAR